MKINNIIGGYDFSNYREYTTEKNKWRNTEYDEVEYDEEVSEKDIDKSENIVDFKK
jgi:hypothetical protein